MNKRIIYIVIQQIFFFFCCFHSSAQPIQQFSSITVNIKPDYSDFRYWAAHPWIKDNSDSVPEELKKHEKQDSLVDVFFIHPTTYTGEKNNGWNAAINDRDLNLKTDNSTILYQASVFNKSCRIFAPRYRQAHIDAFYTDKDSVEPYFNIAYEDIKNAFEYYLEHYNNGRPIIIASHSQGTKHAGRLLKEYFENKPLYKKLVCAYIIGMPIPEKYFSNIPPCGDETQTGCFVGWRTFRRGYTPEFVNKESFKSIVINPLSWKMDSQKVSIRNNKGGVLKNFNKIVPKVVDAEINNNILWSCKPDVFGKLFFTKKNFHIGDINLFYMNIRENVDVRIRSYKNAL